MRGRDLVNSLVEQADQWKPTYLLGRKAERLANVADGCVVMLDGGEVLRTGAVLITAGIGEFTPRPLPAGDGWLGRGMVHFVPSLRAPRTRTWSSSAAATPLSTGCSRCTRSPRSVTLVHRRAQFRAVEPTVRQARELGVRIITDAEVTALRGTGDGALGEIDIEVEGRGDLVLPAQAVVAALGFTADLGPIEKWGLEIDHRAIAVDSTMATVRPRVYAAGDVAAYPGKVKLIATGFGEAATAVNNIAVALDPDAHLFPGHSSNAE